MKEKLLAWMEKLLEKTPKTTKKAAMRYIMWYAFFLPSARAFTSS